MLVITVLGDESFDNETGEFSYPDAFEVELEHSLVSLSKWESIYEKPFLGKDEKTDEEALAYVSAMIVTPGLPKDVVLLFSDENMIAIQEYIETKRTATWFNNVRPQPKAPETLTSELIYYWMTVFNIPFTAETWNLNRLFTLIRVCDAKSSKPRKMSRAEISARNRELNAQRRAALGTTG